MQSARLLTLDEACSQRAHAAAGISKLGGQCGGVAVAVYAQQPERQKRIGVLTGIAGTDTQTKARLSAFLEELQRLGWTEGRNIKMDIRGAAGDIAAARKHAAELIALGPDIILAIGNVTMPPLTGNDAYHSNRFCRGRRSGRDGIRQKSVEARRQRDGLHDVRIQLEWEVARVAQANRPARHAGSGPSRAHICWWYRAVRRYSGRGSVGRP